MEISLWKFQIMMETQFILCNVKKNYKQNLNFEKKIFSWQYTNMAAITVNVEQEDKELFNTICNKMGMNISTAINIFIKKVNATRSIPFRRPNPCKKVWFCFWYDGWYSKCSWRYSRIWGINLFFQIVLKKTINWIIIKDYKFLLCLFLCVLKVLLLKKHQNDV